MTNPHVSEFFPSQSNWRCTWQDEYGGFGTLNECINLCYEYIVIDLEVSLGYDDSYGEAASPEEIKAEIERIRQQCLLTGHASSEGWWSITYDPNPKFIEINGQQFYAGEVEP